MVGYSRLIGADEAGTLARRRTLRREVVEPLVAENGGRVFKTTGDGLLAEFSSVVQALRCAVQKNGRWYERGLLHPFLDYDAVPEYLNSRVDAMDAEGNISMPQRPGLGDDINFDYIRANLVG